MAPSSNGKTLETKILFKSGNAGSNPDSASKVKSMQESKYLQYLLNEIGHSVHNLNTIAVALSNLPNSPHVNPALNITWNPKDLSSSAVNARRFAIRSAIVLAAETLFEYMHKLSADPLWQSLNLGLDFRKELASQDSKAKRFSEICKKISGIDKEWYLLSELLCHWRNRVVHVSTSKASLSATDRQYLKSKEEDIYSKFYHFEINKTLFDYDADKVTLKETTTLITFIIMCCREIDKYFLNSISKCDNIFFQDILVSDQVFQKILKQPQSSKKNRQISRFLKIKFYYLTEEKISTILMKYI